MQRRQQYLIGGLITVVVLWLGYSWVNSAVLGPIQDKRDLLAKLTKSVGDKEDQQLNLQRSKKLLREWQGRSQSVFGRCGDALQVHCHGQAVQHEGRVTRTCNGANSI